MMIGNRVEEKVLNEACDRTFTPMLRHSIGIWSESLTENGTLHMQSSPGVVLKRLEIIASEASYLGYPRLLRICKAIKSCVEFIQAGGRKWGDVNTTREMSSAWDRAWKLIATTVLTPGSLTATETGVAVRSLQQAFGLKDEQIKNGITLRSVMPSQEFERGTSDVSEDNHQDTNVYRKDVIGALDHCPQEESWIVSQLANVAEDLATGVTAHRPAHRLMKVLRGHRFFQYVDRVCLAGRVPGANQLVIVDSAVSERSVRNELLKGYSCFVNPNGSLFTMQPSTVRVFGDCNKVLESFHQQNKPAQRSIALIAEQGLRSGLCMAIGRGPMIQGFLFLNSMEPNLFSDVTSRYAPLLSLFGLVGTISLDAAGFHGVSEHNACPVSASVPNHSIHFVASQLDTWLRAHLSYWIGRDISLEFQVQENLGDFLYLPRVIIQAISDSLLQMVWNETLFESPLRIKVERSVDDIRIAVAHGANLSVDSNSDRIQAVADAMNQKMSNFPIRFSCDSHYIQIAFPFEPTIVGVGGQLYSIVH